MEINFNILLEKRHLLPFQAPELESLLSEYTTYNNECSYKTKIRLHTLYKCVSAVPFTLPKLLPNCYPITGILTFKSNYNRIDADLATWVSSGGTRIVPILEGEKFIEYCHALIIPEYPEPKSIDISQLFLEIKSEITPNFPVLALGNSAAALINVEPQIIPSKEVPCFFCHNCDLFEEIEITVRVRCEYKKKIQTSESRIKKKYVEEKEIIGIYEENNEEYVLGLKREMQYYLMFKVFEMGDSDVIQICHGIINNFVEHARKSVIKIKEKLEVEHYKYVPHKLMNASNKMIIQENHHYNIDIMNKK